MVVYKKWMLCPSVMALIVAIFAGSNAIAGDEAHSGMPPQSNSTPRKPDKRRRKPIPVPLKNSVRSKVLNQAEEACGYGLPNLEVAGVIQISPYSQTLGAKVFRQVFEGPIEATACSKEDLAEPQWLSAPKDVARVDHFPNSYGRQAYHKTVCHYYSWSAFEASKRLPPDDAASDAAPSFRVVYTKDVGSGSVTLQLSTPLPVIQAKGIVKGSGVDKDGILVKENQLYEGISILPPEKYGKDVHLVNEVTDLETAYTVDLEEYVACLRVKIQEGELQDQAEREE